MIRYLIKNNFKIMFRSPVNILLYVLCPVIISAILMSAFSTLMETYEGTGDFIAGYRVEAGSRYEEIAAVLEKAGKEQGISFVLYEAGTPRELIEAHDLGGFVLFNDEGYTVYKSSDARNEGAKLEYLISAVFNSMISGNTEDISIPIETPEHAPEISSTDYYGMVYIIYFGWCAIVCAAGLFSQEKKHRIPERLRVSNLSTFQIFLGRAIPLITAVSLGTGIASVFSALALGTHWGNIALSALLILLSVIAASTFEMMIYEVTQSMIATIILSFSIVWVLGYLGGVFETYMFSRFPESAKLISPLYHTNRALVELSGSGSSDYVLSSVLYCAAITVICSAITVFIGSVRRKDS